MLAAWFSQLWQQRPDGCWELTGQTFRRFDTLSVCGITCRQCGHTLGQPPESLTNYAMNIANF